MADDYEGIADLENLSDDELRSLIRARLDEQVAFDPADVEVSVTRGVVCLSGRVGTEPELRIIERLITDVIGVENVENDLVVDPIRRAESPVAIDEHLADESAHSGLLLGDVPKSESPEAEHLQEDVAAELEGTTDVGEAIREAVPWIPPESPTPEGMGGSEPEPGAGADKH